MHSLSSVVNRRVDFTDESVTGMPRVQYTSFEKKSNIMDDGGRSVAGRLKNGNSKQNDSPRNSPPNSVPADLITYEFTIDPDRLICFYGRESFLSNFYTAPMKINGCTYPTVEHYYEACKLFAFGGPMYSSQLKSIRDPGAVKTTVKRLMSLIDKRVVNKWKRTEGIAVLENALMNKFGQHKDLRDKLLSTGDALLVHANPYETLWASGMSAEKVKEWAVAQQGKSVKIPREINGDAASTLPLIGVKGQNVLGYLLMQIRYLLNEKKKALGRDESLENILEEEVVAESAAAVAEEKPRMKDDRSTKGIENICLQLAKITVEQQNSNNKGGSPSLEQKGFPGVD